MTRHKPSKKEMLEHFGFGTKLMKRYKVCSCCGNKQKASNRVCEVCHTILTENTLFDTYVSTHSCCGQCGNVIPDGAEFCPACGAKQHKKREVI